MERKTLLAVVLVGLMSIMIRLTPTLRAFAVGNDFGIFYSILQDFVRSGTIVSTFSSPWGSAGYGDFPMMYWVIIGFWKLTGISYTLLLIKIPPILGGLEAVIIFFIAYRITGKNGVSLLAAVFAAVNPVLVFQTSLSADLVFGHFFGILMMMFFIYYIEDERYLIPAKISGIFLVLSHPLSTYIYLIGVLGIILVDLMIRPGVHNRIKYALFIYPISAFMFLYWHAFFPNYTIFMHGGLLGIPALYDVIIYFGLVTLAIVFPSRILLKFLVRIQEKVKDSSKDILKFTLFVYSASATLTFFIMMELLPSFSIFDALSLIPLLANGALAIIGMNAVRGYSKNILGGWLVLMAASFVYSLVTWNMVLYPGRYFEYFFEPFSILESIGFVAVLDATRRSIQNSEIRRHPFSKMPIIWTNRHDSRFSTPLYLRIYRSLRSLMKSSGIHNGKSVAVLGLLAVLLTASAVTPGQVEKTVTPSGNQSISIPDYHAALWLEQNATDGYSVATDHILGLLLDGYNLTGTFESVHYLWNATSLNASVLDELLGYEYSSKLNYTPIGYILIDNFMLENGVWGYEGLSDPYAKAIPLTNLSFAKFFETPFVPVYFNYTSSSNWAIVFQVNWSNIDHDNNLNVGNGNYTVFDANLSTPHIMSIIYPATVNTALF